MPDTHAISSSFPTLGDLGVPARSSGCIEMFGLCGAGKSTITNRLAPLLGEGDQRVSIARPIEPGGAGTIAEAAWLTLRTVIADPAGIGSFLLNGQGTALIHKLGYRLVGMRIRKASHGTFLLDSGILQPFVTYYVEQNLRRLGIPLRPLLSALPFPAAAVYVRAEPDVACRRYVLRQRETGGALDERNLDRRFEDGFAFCEWLHAYCAGSNLPTMVIDSSDPLGPEQLADLAGRLESLVRPR